MEEQREAVQKAADAYIAEQYDANAKVAAAVYSKEGALTLCISGQACNSQLLERLLDVDVQNRSRRHIIGKALRKVQAVAHYFEDGNVQMNTQNEFSKDDISFATAEELGKPSRLS